MQEKKPGPFKRTINKKAKDLSIHSYLTTIALIFIAISQAPIAIKATLDIYCISIKSDNESTKIFMCK